MKKSYFSFLMTLIALLPLVLSAQVPDLGVLASFALYTPVGALANAGISTTIIGNIGTNTGSITGYMPTSVVGQTDNNNATTQQGATDVQAAYDYLVALPCPSGAGLAPAMGSGQILTPGTYCFGGAASVAGDLILDGQNQSNPLFIFKMNGAFTVAGASRVLLINGASAANVYWQINGAASLVASSVFAGIIIAHGAITLGDGVSLHGKGLSTVGAISTYNNRIASTTGKPLPVTLVAFTAQAQGSTATALAWSTASEKNSARFEVERSTNGTAFDRIGTVPTTGNSSSPRSYSLADETLPAKAGLLYYRLRQVDTDGTFTYSPVRVVNRNLAVTTQLVVYPNPAREFVHVQLIGPMAMEPLQLLDAHGRTVRTHLTLEADGVLSLTGLPVGLYVLRCGPLAQRLTLE